MTKGVALCFVGAGVLLLGGAALSYWRGRADPALVCTRAADRWTECLSVTPHLARMAESKRDEGIPACVADANTVAMYEACLPEPDCARFMQCLEGFVRE